jgi:CheY-like chemotaxis protein
MGSTCSINNSIVNENRGQKQSDTLLNASLEMLVIHTSQAILKMDSLIFSRKYGYTVTTVEKGADALELIRNKYIQTGKLFDVILLSVRLSDMKGVLVANKIREIEFEFKAKRQLIIGTTPNLLDADLEGGKSFDKIVLKPCDWKELNTIIIKELNK